MRVKKLASKMEECMKIKTKNPDVSESTVKRLVSRVIKGIIFIVLLPLLLVQQIGGLFSHLCVFIFDTTYDHEAAMSTFYPIVKHYRRFFNG
jgi:hypothetical protein